MTKRIDPVTKLANRIKRSTVFEDRTEYDVQDLAQAYTLSREDAARLQALLHSDDPHYTEF